MKNKFIILTLCFTIIFTSINLNSFKSYANNIETNIKPLVVDGGIISAPMVATVVSIATATGLVLNNNDDIYKVASDFYNKYKDNWEYINTLFSTCVSIGSNKVVTVGKEFKEKVISFLDTYFNGESYSGTNIFYQKEFAQMNSNFSYQFKSLDYYMNGMTLSKWEKAYPTGIKASIDAFNDNKTSGMLYFVFGKNNLGYYHGIRVGNVLAVFMSVRDNARITLSKNDTHHSIISNTLGSSLSYRVYFDSYSSLSGTYNPGLLGENDDLDIYIPGNVGDLVGGNVGVLPGTGNPSFDLPSNGLITLPGVENPSISVDTSLPFPGVSDTPGDIPGDVPNEGLFSDIKDFLISLLVPSDTFWTDTFGGFRDNLSKNFPMLDMSKFDSLLVDGKPFPNIYAYGSKVVDGDIINSIVDWLRPIIAGFIMICLMFFNYRKVYKIIRNSEPFGNIAPGTSDFSTGLSSQDIKQIVADAKRETERRTYRR